MIVDGRAIAEGALARAKARAEKLPRVPLVVALVGADTPATRSYLKIKERAAGLAGCAFQARPLGADVSDADAVIVQLPVPAGVNRDEILNAIPLEKDADVLSRAARARFESGEEMDDFRSRPSVPPVAGAVEEILKNYRINYRTHAVILGNGFLVGAPCATRLRQLGASVQVVDIDTPKEEISAALGNADLVVSGIGVPHFIQPHMIKDGVVLIDAGTSELGGKLAGDADPACAEKCAVSTPVPGGVGPIAVAKLFENVVVLASAA